MRKEKKLLHNFGLLAIGNASVKILSLLLIPLYTNILSTEDYGIYELILTTIGLVIPIVTLDITDATLRFTMDPDLKKNVVYWISQKYCFIGIITVLCLLIANHLLGIIDFLRSNEIVFGAIFAGTTITGVMVGYAKGIGKVKEIAFSGALGAIITGVVSVTLIVIFKMGITGLYVSNIAGNFSQVIYLSHIIRQKLDYSQKEYDKSVERSMLSYSLPLITNNVAWWVNSALDRYFVTAFWGPSENGVYSISYKIPTVINLVQSLFHQAWTLSAIQEYDNNDAKVYFLNTYNYYNYALVAICTIILLFNKLIARLFYAKDFFAAWRYVPFLCIGFVFLGLANCIGSIFNAVKNTRVIASTTIAGAIINCILNIILIPRIGVLGAALATMISYFSIWMIRSMAAKKLIGILFFSLRDIISYLLILFEALIKIEIITCPLLLRALVIGLLVGLYEKEILSTVKLVKRFFKMAS